jgi:hypothetical protein
VTLKDYDAVQAIYHSPLLTALTTYDNVKINYQNATGYVLKINSGLMDICTNLRQPNHLSFGPGRCKQTIARPSIGNIDSFFVLLKLNRIILFRPCNSWCNISCYWNCLYW